MSRKTTAQNTTAQIEEIKNINAMDYQDRFLFRSDVRNSLYQINNYSTLHRLVDSLRHLFQSLFVNPEIIRLSRSPDWPWYTITESPFYKSDPKADNKKKISSNFR